MSETALITGSTGGAGSAARGRDQVEPASWGTA